MFNLVSKFKPSGDQPEAINKLVNGIKSGEKNQVFLTIELLIKKCYHQSCTICRR
jgi:excinuclease UvrABC helicase subunit UvrB